MLTASYCNGVGITCASVIVVWQSSVCACIRFILVLKKGPTNNIPWGNSVGKHSVGKFPFQSSSLTQGNNVDRTRGTKFLGFQGIEENRVKKGASHLHWENQMLCSLQLEPLPQHSEPLKFLPPHCPHTGEHMRSSLRPRSWRFRLLESTEVPSSPVHARASLCMPSTRWLLLPHKHAPALSCINTA